MYVFMYICVEIVKDENGEAKTLTNLEDEVCVCEYVCMYVYVYIYIYICVCVCV